MVRAIILAAGLYLAAAASTSAQKDDRYLAGTVWQPECERNESSCTHFVAGLITAHAIIAQMHPEARLYCADTRVTVGQIRRIAIEYMRRNPKFLHLNFEFIVFRSVAEAFPCPKGK